MTANTLGNTPGYALKTRDSILGDLAAKDGIQFAYWPMDEAQSTTTVAFHRKLNADSALVTGTTTPDGTSPTDMFDDPGYFNPTATSDRGLWYSDTTYDSLCRLDTLGSGDLIVMFRAKFLTTFTQSLLYPVSYKPTAASDLWTVRFRGGGDIRPELKIWGTGGDVTAVSIETHTANKVYTVLAHIKGSDIGSSVIAVDGNYAGGTTDGAPDTLTTLAGASSGRALTINCQTNATPALVNQINSTVGDDLGVGSVYIIKKDTQMSTANISALFTEFNNNPNIVPWSLLEL